MTNPRPSTGLPATTVRQATSDDHDVLGRLWLLFRHDMSAHTGVLPKPDGSYRSERLRASLADPGWSTWLLLSGVHPIGFALARALDQPVHVLNSFFLVAPARRIGLGTAMARTVVTRPAGNGTRFCGDALALHRPHSASRRLLALLRRRR